MGAVRSVGLAGLVLAVVAVPVTAYALSGTDDPGRPPPPAATHSAKPHDATEAPETADPEDAATPGRPDDASTPGRLHAAAMKAWAHCVAEAASGPKTGPRTGPPKLACGDKPMGPGRAKHLAAGTGPFAPGKSGAKKQKSHAKNHGHRSP